VQTSHFSIFGLDIIDIYCADLPWTASHTYPWIDFYIQAWWFTIFQPPTTGHFPTPTATGILDHNSIMKGE
jgi:hypothetical protein